MAHRTGLGPTSRKALQPVLFASASPSKHAVTMPARMATPGLKPVVATTAPFSCNGPFSTMITSGHPEAAGHLRARSLRHRWRRCLTHQGSVRTSSYLRVRPNFTVNGPKDDWPDCAHARHLDSHNGPWRAAHSPRGSEGVPLPEEGLESRWRSPRGEAACQMAMTCLIVAYRHGWLRPWPRGLLPGSTACGRRSSMRRFLPRLIKDLIPAAGTAHRAGCDHGRRTLPGGRVRRVESSRHVSFGALSFAASAFPDQPGGSRQP